MSRRPITLAIALGLFLGSGTGAVGAQDAGPAPEPPPAREDVDGGGSASRPDAGEPDAEGLPPDHDAEGPQTPEDDLEAELAAELGAHAGATAATGAAPSTNAAGTASSRGLSNLMNPAISATGIFLAGWTRRAEPDPRSLDPVPPDQGDLRTGLHVQEVELRLSSIVDAHFRADLTLTATEDGIEFEEALITTLEIPRVALRAGQMYANLGRHNLLHTHAFPFVAAPLPWRALLGPEGLKDVGVSADFLLPFPFFAEINAQVFRGEWRPLTGEVLDDPTTPADESVPDQRRDGDLAYMGHLKTLFEVNDSTTVEVGATYLGGRNGFGRWGSVVAGDLTLKWRPVDAERYRAFEWTTEYVWVDRPGDAAGRDRGGAYTAVRYQLLQRWWAELLGSVLGVPATSEGRTWRGEALVAFVPSEFSTLRLQYALEAAETGGRPIHEVFVQAVFSVGSHPTHAY